MENKTWHMIAGCLLTTKQISIRFEGIATRKRTYIASFNIGSIFNIVEEKLIEHFPDRNKNSSSRRFFTISMQRLAIFQL